MTLIRSAKMVEENNQSMLSCSKNVKCVSNTFVLESHEILKKRFKGTDNTTTWRYIKDGKHFKLWQGSVVDSSWMCMKVVTEINRSADDIAMYLNDIENLPIFDEMIDSATIVEYLSPDSSASLRHIKAKGIFPTAPRDFLVISGVEYSEDGTIYISTRSVEDDRVPEKKGYVRATTIISGYIIRPINKHQSEVTLVCHIDLCGYIPSALINSLGTHAPVKLMQRIKELCELDG